MVFKPLSTSFIANLSTLVSDLSLAATRLNLA